MSNWINKLVEFVLSLLQNKTTEQTAESGYTSAIPKPEKTNPLRPYVDYNSKKIGEVEITNIGFPQQKTGYSVSAKIPQVRITVHAIEAGKVVFNLFVDGNRDSINNPEKETAVYTKGDRSIVTMDLPNGPTARQVGKHTLTIEQVYLAGRDDTTGEYCQMYATKTLNYEVFGV